MRHGLCCIASEKESLRESGERRNKIYLREITNVAGNIYKRIMATSWVQRKIIVIAHFEKNETVHNFQLALDTL